jgi:hypothetical protein
MGGYSPAAGRTRTFGSVLERLLGACYILFIGGVFGAAGYARLGHPLPRRVVQRCEWWISRGDRVPIPAAWVCVTAWWVSVFAAIMVVFGRSSS